MKRLTKEWYNQYLQVLVCNSIQQSCRMEDMNEDTYSRLYKKAKKHYIEQESQNPIYYDAKSDLRRLDRAISSRIATQEEKERKKEERLTFIYKHKDELENGPRRVFNESEAVKVFNRKLKYVERIIRTLPELYITTLSDPKFLALGYGTKEDITAMQKFAETTLAVLLQTSDMVRCRNERAAANLSEEVEFDLFTESILLSIKKNGNDIELSFFDGVMRLYSAKVIEQEKLEIMPYDDNNPTTPFTRVIGIELEYDERTARYQISFLMESRNEEGEEGTWYLSFDCDNITAIMSQEKLD